MIRAFEAPWTAMHLIRTTNRLWQWTAQVALVSFAASVPTSLKSTNAILNQ